MVFYAAFNSISVISRRQLTLFMLFWVSPVLINFLNEWNVNLKYLYWTKVTTLHFCFNFFQIKCLISSYMYYLRCRYFSSKWKSKNEINMSDFISFLKNEIRAIFKLEYICSVFTFVQYIKDPTLINNNNSNNNNNDDNNNNKCNYYYYGDSRPVCFFCTDDSVRI